jgi:hypothetical protein
VRRLSVRLLIQYNRGSGLFGDCAQNTGLAFTNQASFRKQAPFRGEWAQQCGRIRFLSMS